MRVRIEGLRELEKALADLPKATGKNVLRRVLKGAAAPIEQGVEARAPELTGHLVSVVNMGFGLTRRQKRLAGKGVSFLGYAGNGMKRFRQDASTGVEIHIGPATDAVNRRSPDPAGLMNEFGNRHMAAAPFMRPAWDAGKMKALDHIKDELGTEIKKAATRLARKRVKG